MSVLFNVGNPIVNGYAVDGSKTTAQIQKQNEQNLREKKWAEWNKSIGPFGGHLQANADIMTTAGLIVDAKKKKQAQEDYMAQRLKNMGQGYANLLASGAQTPYSNPQNQTPTGSRSILLGAFGSNPQGRRILMGA